MSTRAGRPRSTSGRSRCLPPATSTSTRQTRPYGPWLLGDTGLVIEGTGYVLDLSTTTSPAPWSPAWRGLTLGTGTATGEKYVPDPCNTGYLRGHYTYDNAIVVNSGFFGSLYLAKPVTFGALSPLGQTFTFAAGAMDVWYSQIVRGELRDGRTTLPYDAVCDGRRNRRVRTPIAVVSIQPDLDLAGAVDHGNNVISWGELTRHGDEVIAWSGIFGPGYLYLPAGPYASFSPVATGAFAGPSINSVPDASLAELEAYHVAGISFPSLTNGLVYSPDRPRGRANPIKLERLQGWIRVGMTGVDGALSTYFQTPTEELGDPKSTGYVGNVAFQSKLFANDKRNLLAEFATSASSDSNFAGFFEIPKPCDIKELDFAQMKLTSTSCLVGGEVILPSAGVSLAYWGLQLVPTGPPNQAGVVSVRTGRVLLTAAGIDEPVHFARAVRAHLGRNAGGRESRSAVPRLQQLGATVRRAQLQPARARDLGLRPGRHRSVPRRVGADLLPLLRSAPVEHPRRARDCPATARHGAEGTDHASRAAHGARALRHVARRQLERPGSVRLRGAGRRLRRRPPVRVPRHGHGAALVPAVRPAPHRRRDQQ